MGTTSCSISWRTDNPLTGSTLFINSEESYLCCRSTSMHGTGGVREREREGEREGEREREREREEEGDGQFVCVRSECYRWPGCMLASVYILCVLSTVLCCKVTSPPSLPPSLPSNVIEKCISHSPARSPLSLIRLMMMSEE